MNKKTYIKELKETLNKIKLVYYKSDKIEIEYNKSMVTIYLNFCLPYFSIRNLVEFCKIDKRISLAFNNSKAKLSEYHPKDRKKFYIPKPNKLDQV